jgi:flagellar biosynthesis protein FlhG
MLDQASQLRKLMWCSVREPPSDPARGPRVVVLSGGKGGVGVTTLAVHLSVALAYRSVPVVLVDANLYRADVAALCGVTERGSVADVLAARREIHEVLVRGPAGVLVLPGLWAPGTPAEYTAAAQERLLRQFQTLGPHAQVVVLDAGNGGSAVVRRFWAAADDVLLVTTPDAVSVMDSYATIKCLATREQRPPLQLLVNQAEGPHVVEDVHRRIDMSCQRFLGFGVGICGGVPPDEGLRAGGGWLAAGEAPTGSAAAAVARLAAALLAEHATRTPRRAVPPPHSPEPRAGQENAQPQQTY